MQEFTEVQFKQLAMQINKMPVEKLKQIFDGCTYQGRMLTTADFPQIEKNRKEILDSYLNQPKPNAAEVAEWARIVPLLATPGDKLLAALSEYVAHWQPVNPLGNHLEEARSKMQEVTAAIEGADWLSVDSRNLLSLEQYLKKYPGSVHRTEIDDACWNLLTASSEALADGARRYLVTFPEGRHAAEAQDMLSSLDLWESVRTSGDLMTLSNFIKSHPYSSFRAPAEAMMADLKQKEIQEMKQRFNEYSREDLLYYLKEGVFTEDELCENGVATKKSILLLNNYKEVADALPNLDEVIAKCRSCCFEDHTDVFMFGIPGTGKSCILTGLVGTDELRYNSVLAGGEYADALAQFVSYGCPPPPTRESYLTTIEAALSGMKENNQLNLVEMAGEEFAFKISENDKNLLKFEDMGSGSTQLLGSPNRKVFFLVVDPTKTDVKHVRAVEAYDSAGDIYYKPETFIVRQRKCLKRMVDLFGLKENEAIMQRVDAIHIILTKSDMLDCRREDRDQKAVEIFMQEYAPVVGALIDTCRKYGINKSTGGRPKLYTFSLGQFYVGNIFDYDATDSLKVLNAIREAITSNRRHGFFGRF